MALRGFVFGRWLSYRFKLRRIGVIELRGIEAPVEIESNYDLFGVGVRSYRCVMRHVDIGIWSKRDTWEHRKKAAAAAIAMCTAIMALFVQHRLSFCLSLCRCRAWSAAPSMRVSLFPTHVTSRLPHWLLHGPPLAAGPRPTLANALGHRRHWPRRLAGTVHRVAVPTILPAIVSCFGVQ